VGRPIVRRTIGPAIGGIRRGVAMAGTIVLLDVVAVDGVITEHELLSRARPGAGAPSGNSHKSQEARSRALSRPS
jgi:hypothetical protein